MDKEKLLNNLKEGDEGLVEEKDEELADLAGTSPAAESAGDEPIELNNSTVPTPKEVEEAGLLNGDGQAEEPEPEAVSVEAEAIVSEAAPEEEPAPEVQEEFGVTEGPATQTFTQSQVDEIAGKTRKETREKTLRAVYSRYGVNSEEELDDLFGNAQAYDTLKEQYHNDKAAWKQTDDERNATLSNLSEQVALLQSGINKDRYDDAKFILKGKGLDVTLENIESELATHPEWKPAAEPENDLAPKANPHFVKKPAIGGGMGEPRPEAEEETKISVLGNNGSDIPAPELSERDIALKKIFKV